MYPSRGRRLWSGDISQIPFVDALRELLKIGNARIVYSLPDGSVFMLEVSSDGRAGCLARTSNGEIRGEECITELARLVLERQGSIELIELTKAEATLDFSAEPATLLSKGIEAIKDLIDLLASMLASARTPVTGATVPRRESPPQAQLGAGLATTSPASSPVVAREELPVLKRILENYNPLSTAAIIAQGDRILFNKPETSCIDIAAEVLKVPNVRAVILCQGEGEKIVLLVEKGGVKPLVERDNGEVLLGREAALRAASTPASNAVVYVVH